MEELHSALRDAGEEPDGDEEVILNLLPNNHKESASPLPGQSALNESLNVLGDACRMLLFNSPFPWATKDAGKCFPFVYLLDLYPTFLFKVHPRHLPTY